MEKLTQASHKLAEEIYKQAASKGKTEEAQPGNKDSKGSKEDIVDADYEVKDDKDEKK